MTTLWIRLTRSWAVLWSNALRGQLYGSEMANWTSSRKMFAGKIRFIAVTEMHCEIAKAEDFRYSGLVKGLTKCYVLAGKFAG